MAEGRDGWQHDTINSTWNVQSADLVWWTWKGSARKFGHVGGIVKGRKSQLLECAHASQSQKSVVVVPFKGSLITDIDRIGRLK